jgi:hypothetical protein
MTTRTGQTTSFRLFSVVMSFSLALSLGTGVWTVDDDFFGCGVPVWTTQTLLAHLASGRARLEG